jgi:hypothetical protein
MTGEEGLTGGSGPGPAPRIIFHSSPHCESYKGIHCGTHGARLLTPTPRKFSHGSSSCDVLQLAKYVLDHDGREPS